MAQNQETNLADTGIRESNTPVWDGYSGEMYPYLEHKRGTKTRRLQDTMPAFSSFLRAFRPRQFFPLTNRRSNVNITPNNET